MARRSAAFLGYSLAVECLAEHTASTPPQAATGPNGLSGSAKAAHEVECVLQGVGEDGWDVSLRRDGSEFYGRRWVTRAMAIEDAAEARADLERGGWQSVGN